MSTFKFQRVYCCIVLRCHHSCNYVLPDSRSLNMEQEQREKEKERLKGGGSVSTLDSIKNKGRLLLLLN